MDYLTGAVTFTIRIPQSKIHNVNPPSFIFASFPSPARLNVFAYLTQGALRGSILVISFLPPASCISNVNISWTSPILPWFNFMHLYFFSAFFAPLR
jgi:hypothetical protein